MSSLSCSIPVSVLRATPFSLDWYDSVWAKLSATNEKGTSAESAEGNNAILMTRPDPPSNLIEETQYRTGYVLGLAWSPEADNGSPIIDYTISRAVGAGSFSTLAVSSATNFIVFGLTPGVTYRFKVQARNSVGLSNASSELSLLSAYVPT